MGRYGPSGGPSALSEEIPGDLAVVAYRDDSQWQVEQLPPRAADLDPLTDTLRQLPVNGSAFGLLIVDEDFFIVVRLTGTTVRYLLSDVTAATDWPVARTVLGRLDLPLPDDDDPVQPGGDLAIFADFGLAPMALAAICDDLDRYPDEMLSDIARQLGFGAQFEAMLDNVVA